MEGTPPDRARNDKLALLDQALLFLSSFMSFFFGVAIFYINPPGGTALSSLAVFVVITTLLPLYVGVMRGGIESGASLRERVRGWVYLIFGGGLFLLLLIFHMTTTPVTPTTPLSTILYDDAVAFVTIPFMALVTGFTIKFVSWTYQNVEGVAPSGEDLAATYGTMGAVFLSMIFFLGVALLGVGFNTYPITNPAQSQIITIVQSFVILLPLVVVEFNCHHELLVVRAEKAYQENIGSKLDKQIIAKKSFATRMGLPLVEVSGRSFMLLISGIDRKGPLPIYFAIFAILLLVAENLPSPIFDLSILMILVSEVLLYYGVWKHMKETWSQSRGLLAS